MKEYSKHDLLYRHFWCWLDYTYDLNEVEYNSLSDHERQGIYKEYCDEYPGEKVMKSKEIKGNNV